MRRTLLTRISKLEQYSAINKTILWEDDTESRWNNVYGNLQTGDNAIFIAVNKHKLLVGNITQINDKQSLLCSDIQEIPCSNDQFLQLREIYPERISMVKASFQPFIHPLEINFTQLIDDAKNQRFISFYILSDTSKYEELKSKFNLEDRIIMLESNKTLQNVKRYTESGLTDFEDPLNIRTGTQGLTLNEMLEKNEAIKRKSKKSNNVSRIQNIIKSINNDGFYKFNTFSSYYDAIFNKKVYSNTDTLAKSINKILLEPSEMVYKVSMSAKEITETAFNFFNENHLIVVHKGTKGKGTSSQTQGETFSQQMKIGDYFYLCRGNNNLEIIGRITSNNEECENEDLDEGWLQRSYDVIAEAENENPYQDEKRWWTPNDNSTCISIPKDAIDVANNKIFIPFFNSRFEYKESIANEVQKHNSNNHMQTTLNQILFGPPGTGKTYNTINKAVAIANPYFDLTRPRAEIKKEFDKLMKEEIIVFTTFHQSMSYEDFIEGIKPIEPKNEGEPVIYKVIPGILKNICEHIKKEEKKLAENGLSTERQQNYVLIIDEINRGNVSQIFGELITLIEEDKRLGADEALEVTLPYSKEKFGIPLNLYIIGTMNTADRSVEALDAALRRRFSFEEMLPKPQLIKTEGKLKSSNGLLDEIDLSLLLNTINRRIEKLLDKDHLIGHSYFMSVENYADLKSAFQNKIIPLLQEYFFGDYGKIGLVIGKDFFKPTEKDEDNLFLDFEDYDASNFSERTIYKLEDLESMPQEFFHEAINSLMKK